jgi:hypothetical protein
MVKKYSKDIFGTTFIPKKKNIDCVIGYFARRNIIDKKSGLFREESYKKITKSMIWFYLLYLWIHNHKINQSFFGEIKTKERFVNEIKKMLYQYYNIKTEKAFRITKSQLFDFSVHLIGTTFLHIEEWQIPFLENVQNIDLLKERNFKMDSRLIAQSEKIDDILDDMEYNIKYPKVKKIMITNKDNTHKNIFSQVKLYNNP